MNAFWTGFEKQAAIKPTAFRYLKRKPASELGAKVIDYSKLEAPKAQLPLWKKKMIEAGKTPAKAPSDKFSKWVPPPA